MAYARAPDTTLFVYELVKSHISIMCPPLKETFAGSGTKRDSSRCHKIPSCISRRRRHRWKVLPLTAGHPLRRDGKTAATTSANHAARINMFPAGRPSSRAKRWSAINRWEGSQIGLLWNYLQKYTRNFKEKSQFWVSNSQGRTFSKTWTL